MKINMPQKAEYIIEKLNEAGYEAYIVGGCVRDSILGRNPEDWDITTSAFPNEVKKVFQRTIDTGIQHGTVTVLLHKEQFEVTTYRMDGKYLDCRHPSEVTFTRSLIEDLKRRDFTINAMAYHQEDGLVDIFEGVQDLKRQVIRCVGQPHERFSEDALRMLRAVRFSAQLGFDIEDQTRQAISLLDHTLQHISRERIQVELTKLLTSNHPEQIVEVFQTGLSGWALPNMERVWENSHLSDEIKMMKLLPAEPIYRFAALLYNFAKENDEKELLRGLKLDNHTIEYVTRLIKASSYELPVEKAKLRKVIYELGEDIFPFIWKFKSAYIHATKVAPEKEQALLQLEETNKQYEWIQQKKDCLSLKTLAIDGKDLIELGILPGKEMGEILKHLLYYVFEHPEHNTKEMLLQATKRIANIRFD